jgi:hypothetical protein
MLKILSEPPKDWDTWRLSEIRRIAGRPAASFGVRFFDSFLGIFLFSGLFLPPFEQNLPPASRAATSDRCGFIQF